MEKIEIGATIKDKLSSFTGVVVSRTEYLYDSPGIMAVSQSAVGSDGKPTEVFLSESRCLLITAAIVSAD